METKTRVLIADPNEDFRLMMSEILSAEEDLEVAGCAADGLEALALVKELNVDVVLLELVLPKLDGLGVLRKLSDFPRSPAVLVLSGFVNANVIGEAADLGASYFFSKPCDTPELLQWLRQCSQNRRNAPRLVSRSAALAFLSFCSSARRRSRSRLAVESAVSDAEKKAENASSTMMISSRMPSVLSKAEITPNFQVWDKLPKPASLPIQNIL